MERGHLNTLVCRWPKCLQGKKRGGPLWGRNLGSVVLQQGTVIPMRAYKNAGQGCYSCFLMGVFGMGSFGSIE